MHAAARYSQSTCNTAHILCDSQSLSFVLVHVHGLVPVLLQHVANTIIQFLPEHHLFNDMDPEGRVAVEYLGLQDQK